VLRGKGGHRDNPNAQELRLALRAAMVDSIIVQSNNSNCVEDTDKFLLTLTSLSEHSTSQPQQQILDELPEPEPEPEPELVPEDQIDEETRQLWHISMPNPPPPDFDVQLAESKVLYYMAGYVAAKLKSKVCRICADVMTGELSGAQHEQFLIRKQYDVSKEGLTVPSTQLLRVIQELEAIFVANHQHALHADKVAGRLMVQFEQKNSSLPPCPLEKPCTTDKLICKLYLNVRLYSTLKENNMSFASQSARKNRKLVKLKHL
jgi:hypothetical protein